MDSKALRGQIDDAKREVRNMKRTNPSLFPEYQRLMSALANLSRAQKEVTEAKAAWKKLGASHG